MLELQSQRDIEKISHEILKCSKSLNILPTPVDQILEYAELYVKQDFDLSKIHPDYLYKANNFLKQALGKLRGVLDRREKIIMLDLTQGLVKQKFVKLHEVGHAVLPWQKKIYDVIEDDEVTLDTETRDEFESEANFFASETLFQGDRFMAEMDKLGLGIESSMRLANLFGASVHAALRRYVEYSKNRCALLVLKDRSISTAKLRNKFQSESFTKTFGEIEIPSVLNFITWPFVMDYCNNRKLIQDGYVTLTTLNGESKFQYHFFNNTFNAFVLIFPLGEKKKTRIKIVLSDGITIKSNS